MASCLHTKYHIVPCPASLLQVCRVQRRESCLQARTAEPWAGKQATARNLALLHYWPWARPCIQLDWSGSDRIQRAAWLAHAIRAGVMDRSVSRRAMIDDWTTPGRPPSNRSHRVQEPDDLISPLPLPCFPWTLRASGPAPSPGHRQRCGSVLDLVRCFGDFRQCQPGVLGAAICHGMLWQAPITPCSSGGHKPPSSRQVS